MTMINHLVACENCSSQSVKSRAMKWKEEQKVDSNSTGNASGSSAAHGNKRTNPINIDTEEDNEEETQQPPKKKAKTQAQFQIVKAKNLPFTTSDQNLFDVMLLRMFISCNWSWGCTRDYWFRAFFSMFCGSAKLPNPTKLSGLILNREVTRVEEEVRLGIKGVYATAQNDGWKDCTKANLHAFMFTANKEVSTIAVYRIYFGNLKPELAGKSDSHI
jgi:hypothetical protein